MLKPTSYNMITRNNQITTKMSLCDFWDDNTPAQQKKKRVMVTYPPVSIDPSWTLRERLTKAPPPGWGGIFSKIQSTINLLCTNLEKPENANHIPRGADVLTVFDLCPPENIQVLILGESPYPRVFENGVTEAVGIAFSGRPNYPIPLSAGVILQELDRQIPGLNPHRDGDLSLWAKKGIFMLNTILTLHPGRTRPIGFWIGFVSRIIEEIVSLHPDLIIFLWGTVAQDFVSGDLQKLFQGDIRVFSCSYPSPRNVSHNSFAYNNHFIEANKIKRERNEEEIDWNTH